MTAPKLRFKEFDGDWIYENIQGLVDSKILDKPMDGNHGEIHPTSADYVEDGIPFVMATDIFNGQVYLNKSKKIPKKQADSLRKGFSLAGDILLTHKATIGNVAVVPELNTPYVMLTPQVTYYRILNKEKLIPEFLKNNFESPYFQNELLALCTGATRLYIGISEQRKIPFRYCCIEEQTKIASFLSAVDEKISQLTQKHALLSQYKQGMMQKLFSQQIRFKADDGSEFREWEEKELHQIFQIKAGGDIDKDSVSEVKTSEFCYPIFANSDKNKGFYGWANKFKYTEAVTVTGRGNLGIAVARNKPFYPIVRLLVLLPLIKQNLKFFEEQINLLDIVSESTGVPQLTAPQLSKYKVYVPSFEEQTKIANFLSAIDQKIEVVAQQIEQAKVWKKGLLQQMFV